MLDELKEKDDDRDELMISQAELEKSIFEMVLDIMDEEYVLTDKDIAIIKKDADDFAGYIVKFATRKIQDLIKKVDRDLNDAYDNNYEQF